MEAHATNQWPRWLKIKEAARYSGLSVPTVRRLLSARKLTPLRPVPGRVVIDRLQIDAHISSCSQMPRRGRGIRLKRGRQVPGVEK